MNQLNGLSIFTPHSSVKLCITKSKLLSKMLQAHDSGAFAEAKKKARKALRLQPHDLEAGAVMAHDAILSGKYDDAWRYLT